MYKLNIEGKEYTYQENKTLEQISKDLGLKGVLAAKVNNRIRELSYYVNYDAKVEFIDLSNPEGVRIYQSTLRYLIVYAVKNLYPKASVKFSHFISRSFLLTINGVKESEEVALELSKELDKIIKADYPINRLKVSKEEAKKIYEEEGFLDKIDVIKYRPEETVNMAECNGYRNYMFNYMLPRTSYITGYELRYYYPGIIVQYPRSEAKGTIPEFEDSPALSKMIKEAYQWSRTCKVNNIASMNEFTDTREFVDFVNMCETKHNNMLSDLGEKIKNNIENIKLIAIAGPSSSGKTTFCNRLRVELMSRGIFPLMISIDDYYMSRDKYPLDEYGKPDYEHIESLDIAYFNKQLTELIEGKEVTLPSLNFETGEREIGKKVHLEKGQPILIEGIHGLNERLTESIPRENKFKIFISPFCQLNIDNHNPIMATDIRMLRRIVRDSKFRKTSPSETFSLWENVRKGEFKWIYPFQDEADFTYNTELTYEIMVMKKYALPALQSIDSNDQYYIEANRLIKFLKYIKDIDDKYVPCNSILREFIGDSCFYVYD